MLACSQKSSSEILQEDLVEAVSDLLHFFFTYSMLSIEALRRYDDSGAQRVKLREPVGRCGVGQKDRRAVAGHVRTRVAGPVQGADGDQRRHQG